jgi:SET domain-containing protein
MSDSHFIKFAARGEREIRVHSLEEFQFATGKRYLHALEFESEKIRKRVKKQCSEALENGYVGEESKWLGVLHSGQLTNHYVADVSIRWIDETIGYGLFAEKELHPGDFIGEYTGLVRRRNLISKNFNEYCFAYPGSIFNFRKHMIDAQDQGNELRYANHGETPNAESMGVIFENIFHIVFRAIKDIPLSAEITYNYWGTFWFNKRRK